MAMENPARPHTRSILLSMIDAHMLMVGSANPRQVEVAHRFNAVIARGVADGKAYHHVAAAALGSALPATDLDLLLLDTWLSVDGDVGLAALAEGVARRLEKLGRDLKFRGAALRGEELLSHVQQIAAFFVEQLIPRWRRLGVIT
jgi:hypothetical protein